MKSLKAYNNAQKTTLCSLRPLFADARHLANAAALLTTHRLSVESTLCSLKASSCCWPRLKADEALTVCEVCCVRRRAGNTGVMNGRCSFVAVAASYINSPLSAVVCHRNFIC